MDTHLPFPVAVAFFCVVLSGYLSMAAFWWFTVRRLHGHPEVRNSLGWRPLPGFATLNAAAILTLPRSFARILGIGPLRSLTADAEAIRRNTAPWEQRLGRFAFLTMLASVAWSLVGSYMMNWGMVTGAAIAAGRAATYLLALGALPSLLSYGEARRVRRLKTRGPNKLDDWWAGIMDSLQR
ncbi:hypothetical protein [Thiomonas sp. FB-6]|uniref:hypothetical protein n=1 Tax=Thiomonas sp. FB-6 TaxID=1158291 RepID=UPI0012DECE20|nr:hypothetical protein [Thiomonas sp. FB-6]